MRETRRRERDVPSSDHFFERAEIESQREIEARENGDEEAARIHRDLAVHARRLAWSLKRTEEM